MEIEIQSEKQDGVLLLRVSGRLNAVTCREFDAQVLPHADEPGTKLVLDLAGVSYAASDALRTILEAAKRISAAGGWFALAGADGQVRELIELAGFNNAMPVFDSPAKAVEAARASA